MKTQSVTRCGARHSSCRGFTLIELMLVLVILATLAAIVVPRMRGVREDVDRKAAITQIGSLRTAVNMFETQTGHYPRSLEDLVVQPSDASNWHPYLEPPKVPEDPWKHPYMYLCPGRRDSYGFDVWSLGPDGQDGTADDISI